MSSKPTEKESGQELQVGPSVEQPGKQPTEPSHPNRQTTVYIAASHRQDRSTEAKMESARKASLNYSEETGQPLYINEAGEAIKPEDVAEE
ncbi:uncharacterized protein BYT42DRAFT_644619 [Radiomyces spectabilis]|uniref:uncharacterized protein n=1 Tax=Radiomyces spectabilis TaxID=64574 RepID=UPI0022211F97|nr:uncharacterized protein BYT42DRAFT_644619 [Radiomyces spectabilis]KAI8379329.1 hypothetical protein BYT42DRAFT_644619 [Radiomyces spectabilis]